MISSLALAVAVLAIPTSWNFDFEQGVPPEIELKNAQITESPDLVVGGRKSVLLDSRTDEGEWHEFLNTTPAVKLEKDRLYRVSFHYRIVEPGESKARFYSVFKSRSGGEVYGRFWLWTREKGAAGRIDRLVRPDKDDYFFIIGIRHQAAFVVDNICIQDVTEVPIEPTAQVKPGRTAISNLKSRFENQRYSDGIADMMWDFCVILCDEGAGAKAHNSRRSIVADLYPDFVDWSPIGPLAKEYGIRSSRGGPEYQEFYKFEWPDLWDHRYETFVDSGFAVSLDGTCIQDETWGEGGYFTCHNGRNWHQNFISRLSQEAAGLTAVCQDNISCAPWLKGYGCFCKGCEEKFRAYLKDRYTTEELAERGIPDISTFSARDYFTGCGRWGFGAVKDPVVRDYIKFQHISQLEAWADVVQAVKEVGRRDRRVIPVYGNQIGASGMWPFAVALSQFTDVVEIEEVEGIRDKIPHHAVYYKLGRASGEEGKPVWVRGPVADNTKDRTPMLKTSFWSVHFGEALANGGFRDFSLGMNAPWTGDPNTLDFMDDPALYALYKLFAKFIDDNRALFTRRTSMAKVAIVYSLPSLMFRRFYPLDLDDNSAFERLQETADFLDRSHVPYDALVFGHPEIWDDTRVLASLSRYKVIVLPTIDAISDMQVTALKQFVDTGGLVIVADHNPGTRDENFNLRPSPALVDIPVIDMNAKRDEALSALRASSIVSIEAPETVAVNVWCSVHGSSLDIHLLNYDVNLAENKPVAVRQVRVTVNPPSDFQFDKAVWRRPGTREIILSLERNNGRVSFVVPSLEDYAVISLTSSDVVESASAQMKQQRQLDREAVKELAAEKNLY